MHKHLFAVLLGLIGLGLAGVVVIFILASGKVPLPTTNATDGTTTETATTVDIPHTGTIDRFGTMLAFQSSKGFGGHPAWETEAKESWKTFHDSADYASFLTALARPFAMAVDLVTASEFSSNRDIVGAFAWNAVETDKGTYDWSIPDATLTAAGDAGIVLSEVVQPYASWDSTYRVDPASCVGIDFVYFDYGGGLPVDWDAYRAWLTAAVERYDDDGVDDMPGLTTKVASWEIGNEIEGPCGGELADPANYLQLLKVSYNAIKAADPDALVLNGGALEIVGANGQPIDSTASFWKTFFADGGADYLDVFNVHYNRERDGIEDTSDIWEYHVHFFRDLLNEYGHDATPIWLTEFGTYVGTPNGQVAPNGEVHDTPTQSAAVQEAWTFRTVVIGMAYGVDRYFFDLSGNDDSAIGASALFNSGGKPRDIVAMLQTMGDALAHVTGTTKIADGEYAMTTDNGQTIYALWSGSLPAALAGTTATVVHIDGTATTESLDTLDYSKTAPVLVIVD